MKFANRICFIITGLVLSFQTILAQKEAPQDTILPGRVPLFSGLHTLSIHVRDTITHDSVFKFLVDKLKLPVYYYPVTYGKRKYVGVYAGNLVLEPCGPYTNYLYASDNFRAIFFGLTFEPYESIPMSSMGLGDRMINHEPGDTYIYLQKDSVLCGDNLTVSFLDRGVVRTMDKRIMDSLRYAMNAESETTYKVFERKDDEQSTENKSVNYYNELGIEFVKEICIGYKGNPGLQKWKQLISPSELQDNKIWKGSNMPEFHFIKSNIKEVQSITFRVKSLEKAKQYLKKNNLSWSSIGSKVLLEKSQTFGLSIYLTE
jgi:hypothetical protein